MKKLIIILALVALTFLALLVYGASRSEQQEPRRGCKPMPELQDDQEPDEDDLEGWCPPSFASATKGLQARFARSLGYDPPKSLTNSTTMAGQLGVEPSPKRIPGEDNPKDVRLAKISLVSGSYAILDGPEESKLCLCRAGLTPSAEMFRDEACGGEWERTHSASKRCEPKDERGTLPFGENGGTLSLRAGPKATVTVE